MPPAATGRFGGIASTSGLFGWGQGGKFATCDRRPRWVGRTITCTCSRWTACCTATSEIEGHPLGEEETFALAPATDAARAFSFAYDYGDSWHHDIVIEQTMPSVGAGTPHLIDGPKACPPEDCGGAGGFEHLLEVLADPSDEEHDQLLEWVGGPYDPNAFDMDELNAALELYDRHTRQRRR